VGKIAGTIRLAQDKINGIVRCRTNWDEAGVATAEMGLPSVFCLNGPPVQLGSVNPHAGPVRWEMMA
jgi:hypothetical protein